MNEVGLIRIHQFGGPEMLQWEHSGLPDLGPGEVVVRHEAIGLNFIDTYHRSGLYPISLPSGLGLEAAGVIEKVGPEVTHLNQGDRVAYATAPIGAYSERRVCPSKFLIRIPDNISSEAAAASILKGMTAEFLMERVFKVNSEHTILIHAAGGGVGQIAVRWAKLLGAKVIGTAGSDAKMGLARDAGCDVVIDYSKEDFAETTIRLTDGKGVDAVYDSVGKTTLPDSFKALKPRGVLVSFGQSSGAIASVDYASIAKKSLYFTRPSLFQYVSTRQELESSSTRVFEMIASDTIKIQVNHRYALRDAATAHKDLEARKLSASTLLIP